MNDCPHDSGNSPDNATESAGAANSFSTDAHMSSILRLATLDKLREEDVAIGGLDELARFGLEGRFKGSARQLMPLADFNTAAGPNELRGTERRRVSLQSIQTVVARFGGFCPEFGKSGFIDDLKDLVDLAW
jgi:hypothetical protein